MPAVPSRNSAAAAGLLSIGQVLARLDDTRLSDQVLTARAQLQAAEASLMQAQAAVREATENYASQSELDKRGQSTRLKMVAAEVARDRAMAVVDGATADVALARARELGVEELAIPSSGNAGAATAAARRRRTPHSSRVGPGSQSRGRAAPSEPFRALCLNSARTAPSLQPRGVAAKHASLWSSGKDESEDRRRPRFESWRGYFYF